MSFVTRCTSCSTLFKVVADQLKISEGWVRCGQCATIFNAQSNLVLAAAAAQNTAALQGFNAPTSPPAQSAQIPAKQQTRTLTSPEHLEPFKPFAQVDAEYSIASEIASFRSSKLQGSGMLAEYIMPANAPAEPPAKTASDSTNSSALADALDQRDATPRDQLSSDELTPFSPASARDKSQWLDSINKSAEAAKNPSSAEAETTAATTAPSFVVQAQRAQRWRSPWVRLGFGLLCIGLMAALVFQIAAHDKDYIAARWPQAKPWLDRACQSVGCQVQAFKRIESIIVDASSFNRINKNNALSEAVTQSYRLGITLKNSGALNVAIPHVELTLQDAQDQPILRRVLSPADLGSSLISLAPTQDVAGSLTLQIDTAQLEGNRIQGYRVLAFYP
jgi:predicted Zn finger-like uncharacterized protein